MFGPELHSQNNDIAISLAAIKQEDLPDAVDSRVTEFLTDQFKSFVTALPDQHEWLEYGSDNMHWGIYSQADGALLGITGVRNLGVSDEPAISRIALFRDSARGKGIGKLAYSMQYDYLKRGIEASHFEHAAANKNVGSLRIAASVGFVAVHDDGVRTTMRLRI